MRAAVAALALLISTVACAPPGPAPSWSRCPQWHEAAIVVGWTEDQWPTLDRVMYGESRCDPGAHNRSGATGLLQIMPSWIDDCGGESLYDPTVNLRCGLVVLAAQGWGAWSAY